MSEALEPENKKLRSSEPDLVVVVGDEQKEYHYHSQVMATHSKVIDAMLASSMRESQTRHINFPDLSAEVWESMICFLDPLASRQMTVQDALQVAAAYDKYDFSVGAKCCDHVLFEFFGKVMPRGTYDSEKKPDDVNQMIDAFLLADAANLKLTKERAVKYFKGALKWTYDYGRIIFCENQIQKLAPLIAKEELLRYPSYTSDTILHPLFPELFVTKCRLWESNRMLHRAVIGLRLSDTGCKADGRFTADCYCKADRRFTAFCFIDRYECTRKVDWGGVDLVSIKISRLTVDWVIDDWAIYGETKPVMVPDEDGELEPDNDSIKKIVLWKNPLSRNMPLPPKSGWVPADVLARGEPRIEYLYQNSDN